MINRIIKIIKAVSFSLSVIMIVLVCYLSYLIGNTFSGMTIYLFLLLFINPFKNMYSKVKKEINNPIYHSMVILYSVFIMIITATSIVQYYAFYTIDSGNYARNYFYQYLLYMLIGIILIYIISLFFKKDKKINEKNHSKLLFLFVGFTSLFSLTADSINFVVAINVGIALFSFIMIKKIDIVNRREELQNVYFLLIILSIGSLNMVGIVFIFSMYIGLDKFSLTI